MQTTKQFQTNGVDVTKLHVSGYQLTTALLRGGIARLELNNTASLVLLYLASCYNGGAIFPRISTIAANVGISEISVKRSIAELLNKQCLMKSKRHNGTNANCYVLTNKILSMYQGATNQSIKVLPTCMKLNHEKSEKQQQVVVSIENKVKGAEEETSREASSTAVSVSSETHFNLDEIPEIILKNKKIRNVKRYWGSLRPAVKVEYWEQDAAEKENARLKAERLKEEEHRKERERKEREEQRNAPPFTQTCTREEGWNFCMRFAKSVSMRQFLFRGLCADIIKRFNFNTEELLKLASE